MRAKIVLKWRILFQSLPYAVLLLIAKILLVHVLHWQGFLDLNELRLVITAGVFLVGFMLAGTLSDYKESEKIPGEIADKLEALEEVAITLAVKVKMNVKDIRGEVHSLSILIMGWFYRRNTDLEVHQKITAFNHLSQELDQAGAAPPILGRLLILTHELRKILTRTQVISNTGFLLTGYALLELVIVIISVFLLGTKFDHFLTELVMVFFVELLYVYLYLLIRDIDDPFEYEEGEVQASGEVSLVPLQAYIHRLESRLDSQN
ncbi:MAG: hypothetical protein HC913_06645 [Microscillaceae bacterium]|nr:hypothetical protein [Microscillaceae bacterium]